MFVSRSRPKCPRPPHRSDFPLYRGAARPAWLFFFRLKAMTRGAAESCSSAGGPGLMSCDLDFHFLMHFNFPSGERHRPGPRGVRHIIIMPVQSAYIQMEFWCDPVHSPCASGSVRSVRIFFLKQNHFNDNRRECRSNRVKGVATLRKSDESAGDYRTNVVIFGRSCFRSRRNVANRKGGGGATKEPRVGRRAVTTHKIRYNTLVQRTIIT